MLTGSSICSTSDLSTGYMALESVRAQGPCCFFFSRPLSFPVTQSYLISWTATREEDPGVLMLIRAVGRLLAGLEEPEGRRKTRSNTVTENLLQHEGSWSICEGTLRSVQCQDGFYWKRRTVSCICCMLVFVVLDTIDQCVIPKKITEMSWKWRIP